MVSGNGISANRAIDDALGAAEPTGYQNVCLEHVSLNWSRGSSGRLRLYSSQLRVAMVFYIPALIGFLGALYMWIALRDTPSSVGLPEIHGPKSEEENTSTEFKKFLRKSIRESIYLADFHRKLFCVHYTVRRFRLGPHLLTETKGLQIHHADGW